MLFAIQASRKKRGDIVKRAETYVKEYKKVRVDCLGAWREGRGGATAIASSGTEQSRLLKG